MGERFLPERISLFIYLFGVLRCFQHSTGHIMTGSWKGRGNQYIQFVRVLYCKLPTNGKQLPAFPLEALPGTEPRPQRWEARVLPLCHLGPSECIRRKVKEMERYYDLVTSWRMPQILRDKGRKHLTQFYCVRWRGAL